MHFKTKSSLSQIVGIALLALVVYGATHFKKSFFSEEPETRDSPELSSTETLTQAKSTNTASSVIQRRGAAGAALQRAFENHQSNILVASSGIVEKLLPDDQKGSRHQRFIVRVGSDQTILIAHNIDIATRVPLRAGDEVEFRGEYEWNDKGGVVHWTHHDPVGRHAGGWILYKNKKYE